MDDRLVEIANDIAMKIRAVAVDAEANLTPAERRELVEIALAVERLVRGEEPSDEQKGPG